MCLTAYPRSNEERLPLRRGSGGSWNGNRKRNAAAGIAAITNSVYTLELYASYFYRTLYDLLKSRVGSPLRPHPKRQRAVLSTLFRCFVWIIKTTY